MIEIPLIVGVLIGVFAGLGDLKTGYVDKRAIAGLVCFGLVYWGSLSLFYWDVVYILGASIVGLWFFCVGFVMWKLSGWGGGDWLLLTGYGFLLPFLRNGLFIYPISFLINLAVIGFVYNIVYLGLRFYFGYKLEDRIRFTMVFPIAFLIYGVWGDLFIILLKLCQIT
jgi:Flp pilus assembly protein protease CpaA